MKELWFDVTIKGHVALLDVYSCHTRLERLLKRAWRGFYLRDMCMFETHKICLSMYLSIHTYAMVAIRAHLLSTSCNRCYSQDIRPSTYSLSILILSWLRIEVQVHLCTVSLHLPHLHTVEPVLLYVSYLSAYPAKEHRKLLTNFPVGYRISGLTT